VERAARCVAKHESWNQGLWRAENPNTRISTASGFAQWINGTWRANAARAGVPVTKRAKDAPPADQAEVFAWMVTHGGKRAWDGTGCFGR
jgi:hypothetical protein